MATSRQKRNGYRSENHSHFNTDLTPDEALALLEVLANLPPSQIESIYLDAVAKYDEHPEMFDRDLANLQAIFGGAEE